MPRRWRVKPQWDGDDGQRQAVYYSVCESYRDEDGVPRYRTIENLGPARSAVELAQWTHLRATRALRRAEEAEDIVKRIEASLARRAKRPDPEIEDELDWDVRNLRRWQHSAEAWRQFAREQTERAVALDALDQRTVDPVDPMGTLRSRAR